MDELKGPGAWWPPGRVVGIEDDEKESKERKNGKKWPDVSRRVDGTKAKSIRLFSSQVCTMSLLCQSHYIIAFRRLKP